MKTHLRQLVGTILLVALVYQISCKKENSLEGSRGHITDHVVTATVTGRITDQQKIPVEGAIVSAGSASTKTDINGNFNFSNIQISKNAGYVKVEKPGYFFGSRTFLVKPNKTHYVEIELITKTNSGSFASVTGGTINLSNGGSINFMENSIVNGNNTSYTGSVSVAAFYLNPTAANFSRIMPGDLRGITSSDEETALQSFGMLAVELSGSGGEKLNLATGKSAKITLPIPPSMLSQAPQHMPLWSFDEAKGFWIEEGTAIRQGNTYIASVTHFSFWNVDVPFPLINFELTVKDQSGNVVPRTQVVLKLVGDSAATSGTGYTDNLGVASGKIPQDKTLQLLIYNTCGTVVLRETIGPYSKNYTLTKTIDNSGSASFTFKGKVTACPGTTFGDGFVNVKFNDHNYRANLTNGSYEINVTTCSKGVNNVIITGYDVATNKLTDPLSLAVTQGGTISSDLTACSSTAAQFINFTLNNTDYAIVPPVDSLVNSISPNNHTSVRGYSWNSTPKLTFDVAFRGFAVGTYSIGGFTVGVGNDMYNLKDSTNVIITEYGSQNGYIAGNFTGTVVHAITGVIVPIKASFRVLRN